MQQPLAARRPRGRPLGSGDAVSRAIQSAGGRAKAGKVTLSASLGLADVERSEAFQPYARKAASFRRAHCSELAALAGGHCGTGPSSMVASAALQLAFSRYLFDKGAAGDLDAIKLASKLADSSRQNLLAAYELAVREGQARQRGGPDVPDLDEVMRRAEERAAGRRATTCG
jgi:hypothetical protein